LRFSDDEQFSIDGAPVAVGKEQEQHVSKNWLVGRRRIMDVP